MVIDLAVMGAAEAPETEEPKCRARLVVRGGGEAAGGESGLSFESKTAE